MSAEIKWIHKEIEDMPKMDRAKYSLHTTSMNLRGREFTSKQIEELISYFSREMRAIKINFNQTS